MLVFTATPGRSASQAYDNWSRPYSRGSNAWQDAITNFNKVYEELSLSNNDTATKQLAMQVATLDMQLMVADLRRQQARDQLAAAIARVTDYAAEIQVANGLLGNWTPRFRILPTSSSLCSPTSRRSTSGPAQVP